MTSAPLPIVGMFFRPPAEAIMANLPSETPLLLLHEPGNPHDPNAVAVYLEFGNIPVSERMTAALQGYGFDYDQFRDEKCSQITFPDNSRSAERYFMLGYISRHHTRLALARPQPVHAQLSFDPTGKPIALMLPHAVGASTAA